METFSSSRQASIRTTTRASAIVVVASTVLMLFVPASTTTVFAFQPTSAVATAWRQRRGYHHQQSPSLSSREDSTFPKNAAVLLLNLHHGNEENKGKISGRDVTSLLSSSTEDPPSMPSRSRTFQLPYSAVLLQEMEHSANNYDNSTEEQATIPKLLAVLSVLAYTLAVWCTIGIALLGLTFPTHLYIAPR